MQKLLPLAIALALPSAALAQNDACLVSFAGAQQNICEGTSVARSANLSRLLSLAEVEHSSLRLVKFDGPIQAKQRAALEAAGARIISYAPHYAYIVRMDSSHDAKARQIPGVAWTGPFLPALKVDPNIYTEIDQGGIIDGLGIDMLEVTLDTQASRANVQNAFNTIAGLHVSKVMDVAGELRMHASFERARLASTIEQLAARDDVLSVGFFEPKRLYNSQGHWMHQSNQNSPQPYMPIWNQGVYGCGQIVGELDTGLWMDNVAFKDASQPLAFDKCSTGSSCAPIAAPNFNARKVVAYYKWSGLSGNTWDDNHGHGTHVAGSIIGNNNVANPGTDCVNFTTPGGDTDLDGMAPGAKLVMQEAGGNLAYLNAHGGNIYHAADVAYQNGARIHSNSWGGSCTNQFGQCVSGCTVTYDEESRDSDRLMEDREDLLLVFAAGNDATACSNGNNVGSPGNAKNVLSIGATNRGSAANAMASFSSRGPALDSRTKPDLAAQGSSIMSADRNASGTRSMSGTSMATPTAAGLAALVRDYLARGFYPSGEKTPEDAITNPSGALVKAIMVAGAAKMTGTGAGANPGQAQGFGRILLDDSLHFVGDDTALFIHDEAAGLQTGEQHSYNLDVTGNQPITVVLTWTDVAAAISASPATVNALRLEVEAPNGDIWTQKLPGGYSVNNANPTQGTSATNYDPINNLHRIQFETPVAGSYEIRVRGINVPDGPQKYALAAAGGLELNTDPDFKLTVAPDTVAVCAGSTAEYDVGVRSRFDFFDPVNLTVTGLPASATASFGTNPITPADPAAISALTINSGAGTATGSYPFQITGAASGATPISHDVDAELKVSADVPATATLLSPADNAVEVPARPEFSWSAVADASGYTIEVATDATFATIVANGHSLTTSWTPLVPLDLSSTYVWRVRANNPCGDGANSAVFSFATPQAYYLSGNVTGYDSTTDLVLRLNGNHNLPVNSDGPFAFAQGLISGTPYAVTVGAQPVGQACVVANGTGTIAGADVTNIEVSCEDLPPESFKVGGQISGLAGQIVLQLNNNPPLTRKWNGTYSFTQGVVTGDAYEVSIVTPPAGQICTASNASGTMGWSDITDVDVSCVASGPDIFKDGFEANP